MSEAIDEIVDGLDDEPVSEEKAEVETPEKVEEPDTSKIEQERDNYRRAMKEERQRRQEIEARLEKLEGLKEQIEKLSAARQPETKDPEFMEDPKGYVDLQSKKVQEAIQRLESQAKEGSSRAQEQLAQMQFMQNVQSDESQFIRQNPDYYEALNFIREQRRTELEELGIEDEQEIAQIINREELQAAAVAMNKGTSAAAHYYNRAKRLGYAKEQDTSGIDEAAERMERAQKAQSMGGSNIPEDRTEEPEDEAWDSINAAYKEVFGVELK